jgi:diadenosine tetraphosphate (Ap4A) HIT family hydrolase
MDCPLCERVKLLQENKYPFLIHEFPNSYLMLGEHQYYPGYCVLVTKNHHREMSDITSPEREEIFQELMISSKVLQKTLLPKKMNLCSLGNVVEHLHWHLFPRDESDPLFKNPPWLQMNLFESAKTDLTKSQDLILSIKKELLGLC